MSSGAGATRAATKLVMEWQRVGLDISARDYDVIHDDLVRWTESAGAQLAERVKSLIAQARREERLLCEQRVAPVSMQAAAIIRALPDVEVGK